ncbi:hypothetical protein E2C01_086496 [Portunus trituberculatus]|uniref:Uncharacterized protein n=1 Tax=Portunus trituberculatus TaxID=210409 RepID=A0A5B7JER1_PORTR|nr:hypothetical protein [Portunus trituberculatus]
MTSYLHHRHDTHWNFPPDRPSHVQGVPGQEEHPMRGEKCEKSAGVRGGREIANLGGLATNLGRDCQCGLNPALPPPLPPSFSLPTLFPPYPTTHPNPFSLPWHALPAVPHPPKHSWHCLGHLQ